MEIMGTRGPIPNHSSDLSRDRSRKPERNAVATKGLRRPVTVPEPDPDWHPIATMIWNSMLSSGQTDFYQDSDWAFAWYVCEEVSLYKKPKVAADGSEHHRRSGQLFQTITSALGELLLTEGQRRRVRIELEDKKDDESPQLAIVHDLQTKLKASAKK